MGSLLFEAGSLLDAPEVFIAHGVNDKGVMGAGVALALKTRWPEVFRVYQYAHASGAAGLGHVSWAEVARPYHRVANIISQHGHGRGGLRYVSYDAVDRGLGEVCMVALEAGESVVAIPAIGAGLGGGSWPVLREIFVDVARRTGVNLRLYAPDLGELNPD